MILLEKQSHVVDRCYTHSGWECLLETSTDYVARKIDDGRRGVIIQVLSKAIWKIKE